MGYCSLGAVTFESAAYVARYIMKKINGAAKNAHYLKWDPETGEVLSDRKPEYCTMSRRPGLAKGWFDKYASDVYPSDQVVLKGRAMRPPRFYDKLYEIEYPSDLVKIKTARVRKARQHESDNTRARLEVRELVKQAQISHLPRDSI